MAVCVPCVMCACLYFSLSLDSSSSMKTYNLLALHGFGSLCSPRWKSALFSFVAEKSSSGSSFLKSIPASMQVQTEISDLGMQFFFFFGREVWQGLLKTEVTFQESFKR